MCYVIRTIKYTVAALSIGVWYSQPALSNERLDELFRDLSGRAENPDWVARQIMDELGKSGSAAMDLLLRRAEDALNAGDAQAAAAHAGALIDHAPDFAEAYATRAVAWFQLDQFGLALDDLRSALALEPRHFGAMQGLAAILEQTGDSQGAAAVWRQLLTVFPAHPGAAEALDRLANPGDSLRI